MARTTPGVTRERLLDEAVRLFAARGYSATSVADIQVACGLTAGSGALYKHFPSKEALLAAAVRRNIESMARQSRDTVARAPDDPTETLTLLADAMWFGIESDRDLIRIMLREYTTFPDVFEPMWAGVVANAYREVTRWLTELRDTGRITGIDDPEATATVLVSSLTYFPLLELLTGRTPGDLDPARFRAAWIRHAARTLGLPEPPSSH